MIAASAATTALVGPALQLTEFAAEHARTGDAPRLWTSSATALPEIAPLYTAASVRQTPEGAAITIVGAGVVAPLGLYAVDYTRTYRVSTVIRRLSDASDPNNDAVELRFACLGQLRNPLTNVLVRRLSTLKVASGVQVVSGLLSLAPGGTIRGLAAVGGTAARIPDGTCYGRPYVQGYGLDPATAVVAIYLEDVSSGAILAPDLGTLTATVAGLVSGNYGPRLTYLESVAGSPFVETFATQGDAANATIPQTVKRIVTDGLTVQDDGLGDDYVRTSGTDQDFTSQDGAKWKRARFDQVKGLAGVVAALRAGTLITFGFEGDSLFYGYQANGPVAAAPGFDAGYTRALYQIPQQFFVALNSVFSGTGVANTAVPGSETGDVLARMQAETMAFDARVVMVGTNDVFRSVPLATSRSNLRDIARLCLRRNQPLVLVTPPPVGDAPSELQMRAFANLTRSVAAEFGCPCIDSEAQLAPLGYNVNAYTTDSTHLTAAAYKLIGWSIAAAFFGSGTFGTALEATPGVTYDAYRDWGPTSHPGGGDPVTLANEAGIVAIKRIPIGALIQVGVKVEEPVYPVISVLDMDSQTRYAVLNLDGDTVVDMYYASDDRKWWRFRGPLILPGYRVLSIFAQPPGTGTATEFKAATLGFVSPAEADGYTPRGDRRRVMATSGRPLPPHGGSIIDEAVRTPLGAWQIDTKLVIPFGSPAGVILAIKINRTDDVGASQYFRVTRSGDALRFQFVGDGTVSNFDFTSGACFPTGQTWTGILSLGNDGGRGSASLKVYVDGSQQGAFAGNILGAVGVTALTNPAPGTECLWQEAIGC